MLKVTIAFLEICMTMLMLHCETVKADAANTELESQVKAAFIFNFAKFIDWPNERSASVRSPIVVCVAGADRFGGILQQTLEGKTAHGRPFQTRLVADEKPTRTCDILFIG